MKLVCIKLSLVIKSIIISAVLIVCALLSNAQTINLVPDPSFEDTLEVVYPLATISLKYWKNLDSTNIKSCRAIYFSKFNSDLGYRLPINYWCNQNPHSGNGLICLDNLYYQPTASLIRSITRTRLKSKLIAEKLYCVKINAVFGERYSPYITDGLQLYFDNGELDTMISKQNDSTGIYPQLAPQISLAQGQVLTDTINWNLVIGSFVANGTEEYLTIGNFKSDSATTKILINASTLFDPSSELLIDDVSVYPIDLANWLPPTYGYPIGDSALIGLPNYETPDAKWYTYNMVPIDSGSQIKVLPPASGTKYICGIDMCNTMVFDTVEVVQWPLVINKNQLLGNACLVYPNPTANTLHITNAKGLPKELFSHTGQMIISTMDDIIDVSNLSKGMYYLKCKQQVIKVIIE